MYKKLRAQHISIDLPTEHCDNWVQIILQAVIKDGDKTVQTIDRVANVYRNVAAVAQERKTITDPITHQPVEATLAGCTELIRAFVQHWMVEDCGGEIINNTVILPVGEE